jgi:glycosyltransferase involved in cell wall biosynthesis
VIVPACNEEKTIEATLNSLLASTGLKIEVIAVDDRSTDATGRLMDEVAARALARGGPHRLQVLHLAEVPEGWLGKPAALATGVQRASAPWLLFTDGDVVFGPRALELSLRCAMAQNADHMALMLSLVRRGAGESAVQAATQAMAQWGLRLWKVADPRARDFFGAGGFTLVRAEFFARLGGFSALRMEVVEDLSLACMVKHAGGRSVVALGPGLASIRWIDGVFGIVSNMEKNGFAVMRYNVGLTLIASAGFMAQALLPLAAMAAGGWTLAAGLLTYLGIALTYQANRRMHGISPAAAMLFAPAAAIVGYGFLRSMMLTLARGGVAWRGTLYPLGELRRNAVPWH